MIKSNIAVVMIALIHLVGCNEQTQNTSDEQQSVDEQVEELIADIYSKSRTYHVDKLDQKQLYDGKTVQFATLKERDEFSDKYNQATDSSINSLIQKYKSTIDITNLQPERVEYTISSLKEIPKLDIPSCVWIIDITRFKVSDHEVPILKSYLMSGGMLFSSSESNSGEEEFSLLMSRLFPDQNVFEISYDEPIISEIPFSFPDGPPSASEEISNIHCYGLRKESRIIAIHYPANLVSAWNPTNTNISHNIRDRALQFGTNLLHYGHVRD